MPFTDAALHAALDGLAAVAGFASLHTGDPSTTGANEVAGGSPAYARKSVGYAASASRQKASNTAQAFDVPAGTTVFFVGLFSLVSGGTFYGYWPVGAQLPQLCTVNATGEVFTSYGHGYANGDRVMVADANGAGVPTGLTEGTLYHVVGATTDTFQLSPTAGGAAVDVTASGECYAIKVLGETFTLQGTYTVASGSLVLDGRII